MRISTRWLGAAGALAVLAGLALAPATSGNAATHTVSPGQSIQDAIDGAADGDTILIQPGTYAEDLVINGRTGLTIKGTAEGVVIAPPVDTSCGGFGICVFSSLGVRLERLTVQGFAAGVVILFTPSAHVRDVRAINNGVGILAGEADNLVLYRNTVLGSGENGIEVLASASVNLRLNRTNDNDYGIHLQEVTGATLESNTSNENCAGIVVQDSSAIQLLNNTTHNNTSVCETAAETGPEAAEEAPALLFSGIGILIWDSGEVEVRGNSIRGNRSSVEMEAQEYVNDVHAPSGGLVVWLPEVEEEGVGPAQVAYGTDIVTSANFFNKNDVDMHWGDGPGTGSSGTQNRCKSSMKSFPSGYCNFAEIPAP
ncbi:MAG: nitrous oxide reductase family maturation protein NosD [Dehalococcoidia bacterium]